MENAQAMIAVLELFDASAAIIKKDRTITVRSRRFNDMAHVFQYDCGRRLVASDHPSERRLAVAIQLLDQTTTATVALYGGAKFDCIAHLRRVTDVQDAHVLIVINTLSCHVQAAKPDVLSDIFGLTSAESRLASILAANYTVSEAAKMCGITTKSARSSIEKIYNKVGVSRQTDLMVRMSAARISLASADV